MRMRKKPYRDLVLETRTDLLVKEPNELQNKWKVLLNCEKLHVEIGSGKGDYWRLMSNLYPEEGWVGIERNLNIASIALNKTEENSIPKGRFIADNAEKIDTWFGSNEIDFLHLNFSDPWPKKAHGKRRLTHKGFLDCYRNLIVDGGLIIMKTDNQSLMEFSLESMQENNFELVEYWDDYRLNQHPEDAITEYERRFMNLGQPIYKAIWKVNK